MHKRGFTQNHIALGGGTLEQWWPGVAQSIRTCLYHGGKINFHLDGLDLKALWDFNHPNYYGGTMTELRTLINENYLNDVVFYYNNNDFLPIEIQQQLDDALDKYNN